MCTFLEIQIKFKNTNYKEGQIYQKEIISLYKSYNKKKNFDEHKYVTIIDVYFPND